MGHRVSYLGVQVDSQKIEAMVSCPPPRIVKQIRGFLSLFSYYKCFICGYATLAALLIDLLCNDAFTWI